MTLAKGVGGPFGVPPGQVKFENPDGIGVAGPGGVTHNVYDGKPWPLMVPGDFDNIREIQPELMDPFRKG